MTMGDWCRLREMERELGWEPSEIPPGMTVLPPARRNRPVPDPPQESTATPRRVALSPVEAPAPVWCRCPDEARDTVWVHVPERSTWVASYCAACGRRVRRGGAGQTSTVHFSGSADGMVTGGGGGGGGTSETTWPACPHRAGWDDVAYPSEASEHFAALARIGLEHCLSWCPICLYRLFGPLPDGVKPDASMGQWLEENWGWRR